MDGSCILPTLELYAVCTVPDLASTPGSPGQSAFNQSETRASNGFCSVLCMVDPEGAANQRARPLPPQFSGILTPIPLICSAAPLRARSLVLQGLHWLIT